MTAPRGPWIAGIVVALALAASLPAAPAARAGDPAPVVDPASDTVKPWFREAYYAVLADAAGEPVKVGWMRRALVRSELDGAPVAVREFELEIDVAGDGRTVRTKSRTVYELAAPQRLVAASMTVDEGGRKARREVRRNGARFDVETEARGETERGAVVAADVTLSDELALERLVSAASARGDGAVGGNVSLLGFDIGSGRAVQRAMSVSGLAEHAGARCFVVTVSVNGQAIESTNADARGLVVSGRLGPVLRYEVSDEARARAGIDRASIERVSRVAMDADLGDLSRLRTLVVRVPAALVPAFVPSPRQKIAPDGPREGANDAVRAPSATVTIRRDAALPADDASREAALADDDGLGVRTTAVRLAAQRVLSGSSARGPQAAAIVAWVAANVKKEIELGTPTAPEILASMRGDCTEHARLCVALCRAAGIPARVVEGLAWTGDGGRAFGWHQWVEIAVGETWIPADPTFGRYPADAASIAVDASPQGRTRLWGARFEFVSKDVDPE